MTSGDGVWGLEGHDFGNHVENSDRPIPGRWSGRPVGGRSRGVCSQVHLLASSVRKGLCPPVLLSVPHLRYILCFISRYNLLCHKTLPYVSVPEGEEGARPVGVSCGCSRSFKGGAPGVGRV